MILSKEKDPLGLAILDYYNGKRTAKAIVRSRIADDSYLPINLLFRTVDEMTDIDLIALSECKGKILDLGAGAGSHVLELQARGLEVWAADISPLAVEVMRKRGVKNVLLKDIYASFPHRFDTLLMMMNGIGVVQTMEGLERFLTYAKMLLNQGGSIILDSTDIAYMYIEEDGSMLIDLNGAYYGEVDYQMEYNHVIGDAFTWLYIDYPNLFMIAESLGYKCGLIFDCEGNNYLAKLSL